MRFSIASCLLFIGVAGCGIGVAYVPLNPPPHMMTARPKEQVELFASKLPDRPYVEVASIEVQQEDYNHASPAQLTDKLRELAGRRGCEGLVLSGANDATSVSGGVSNGSGFVSSRTLKGYRGTCIVYKEPADGIAPVAAIDTKL